MQKFRIAAGSWGRPEVSVEKFENEEQAREELKRRGVSPLWIMPLEDGEEDKAQPALTVEPATLKEENTKPASVKRIGIAVAIGAALLITGWIVTKPASVSVGNRLAAGAYWVSCVPQSVIEYGPREGLADEIRGCAMASMFFGGWGKR